MTAPAKTYAPLHQTAPAYARTAGHLATKVGQRLGLPPDPQQQWLLDQCFGEDERGLPSSPDVCIVGPRQTTGKSGTLEVAALTDLYTFRVELHVWTAHEWKTIRKTYEDMKRRIKAHPDYAAITRFHDAEGSEKIFLDTGETIEFYTRSGSSGRGFTTRRLTLDEALFLQAGDVGALVPTGVTIPDFQIRYGSSAGKPKSEALRALRKRGRAGDPKLAYLEIGAERRPCAAGRSCLHELDDPGCALNDRDLWWQSNSGLWVGRVTEEAIERQRHSMAGQPVEFGREFLSWWEDPPNEGGRALDLDRFLNLADPGAPLGEVLHWGVATGPDHAWAAIALAWRRPDGSIQVMVSQNGPDRSDYRPGTEWVADRVAQLRATWGGPVKCNTAAKGLLPVDLKAETPEWEQAAADNAIADAVKAGTVHHGNQGELITAVRNASWKQSSSSAAQTFDEGGDVDISPLVACALAHKSVADVSAESWGFWD